MRKDLELIPFARQQLAEARRISDLAQAEKDELKKEIALLEDQERKLKRDNKISLERCAAEVTQSRETLIAQAEKHAAELKRLTAEFKQAYSSLEEKYNLLRAIDDASKLLESGEAPDRYSKEEFSRLDAQYKAYKKYYYSQWKKARQQIFYRIFKNNSSSDNN